MNGQVAALTAAAQLSAHRRSIMDMLVGCPLITTAEYDTAMNRTLACECLATLQKWYRNTVLEIARREALEPVAAPIQYATGTQKEEIIRLCNRTEVSRAEKTRVLRDLDQYTLDSAKQVIGTLWANIVARAGGRRPTARRVEPAPRSCRRVLFRRCLVTC